jgi:tRNA threonylcarbamoyladenosine biosynthesis protein TsaE
MEDSTGNTLTWEHVTLPGLSHVASEVVSFAQGQKIWVFKGEMGAGKTTLIRSIGKVLGFTDPVTSPTFSLVNEYIDDNGNTFFHFDFYRIEDESEAEDIGVMEYFDSGNICLIEWPSRIPHLLPERHILIELAISEPETRQIRVTKYE